MTPSTDTVRSSNPAQQSLDPRPTTHHTTASSSAVWLNTAVPVVSASEWTLATPAGTSRKHGFREAIERFNRRAFDLAFATTLIVLLAPLLAGAALIIRATSPGPAIYRQRRCGKDGVAFTLYKFRTMTQGADALFARDQALDEAFHQQWKLSHDPRVTAVGRWLRKTSIDELPQLLNIIRGEMSVVGPRPVQPLEFLRCYGDTAHEVFSTKPGLTGLWQVTGRSALTYDERIALDLEYLTRRSFLFDLSLVIRTVPAVLFMRGAV